MADEMPKQPESPARAERVRRRPPTTLDLKATEVASSQAPAESKPAADTPASASAESDAGQAAEPPLGASSFHRTGDPGPKTKNPVPPKPPSWPLASIFTGAIAGGVVAAIMLAAAWFLWAQHDRQADAAQASRLSALQSSVHALAARKPAVDPKSLDALTKRVGALEAETKTAKASELSPRLVGLENTIAALKSSLAKLEQSSSKTAAAVDAAQRRAASAATAAESAQSSGEQGAAAVRQNLDSLKARLASLEKSTQSLRSDITAQQSKLAKQQPIAADTHALALAVAAQSLKQAVAGGESFRTELQTAQNLSQNPAELAPLARFADTGVPTATALGQELLGPLQKMRRLAEPSTPADEGFLGRLKDNAERLVRIRPVGEVGGTDPGAILARVETRATHGNIGGTLAELDKLPPAIRAPAESWIERAKARDAAIDASRSFAAKAMSALAVRSE